MQRIPKELLRQPDGHGESVPTVQSAYADVTKMISQQKKTHTKMLKFENNSPPLNGPVQK